MGKVKLEEYVAQVVFVFFLFVLPPLLNNAWITTLLISILMFTAFGAAFDFSAGYIGAVNFGFAGFLGLGAYTSALLAVYLAVTPWIGIFAGSLVTMAVGIVTGILTLRLHGIYAACFTWFLAETLRFIFANATEVTRGYMGLHVPSFPSIKLPFIVIDFAGASPLPCYYLILIMTLGTLVILRLIVNSKRGLAFKAIKNDELAASTIGINVVNNKVFNFAVSCFFAGLIGGFYAHYMGILTPDVLGLGLTVQVLVVSYVGGRGTIWGTLPGALLVTFLLEGLRPLWAYRFVIYGLLLIGVMIFYPEGLAKPLKTAQKILYARVRKLMLYNRVKRHREKSCEHQKNTHAL
jgi:branched-chain amino acid transport system permease protein